MDKEYHIDILKVTILSCLHAKILISHGPHGYLKGCGSAGFVGDYLLCAKNTL